MSFFELLKKINIVETFIIYVGLWVFYSRLARKLDDFKRELKEEIHKPDNRIEKLSEKVEDIDRRLCRIEGSLQTHGHCLCRPAKSDQSAR